MRGRRAPLSFQLQSGAPTEDLRAARDQLRNKLSDALRASIATVQPTVSQEIVWQPAHELTPALWFDPASELVINDSGMPGSMVVHPGPHAYVRIVPTRWSVPRNFAQGDDHLSLLAPTMGFSWGTSRGGFLTYNGSVRSADRQPLANFSLQFRSTGEIWSVTTFTTSNDGNRFFADAFISNAYKFIETSIDYLERQGANRPFHVRMGATNLSGQHWTTETRWGGQSVALDENTEVSFELSGNSEEELLGALELAWGEFVAAFGVPQPPRSILVRQIRGF